jgi:3-oxoacyl-[acyl-carrier-protein] synthase II
VDGAIVNETTTSGEVAITGIGLVTPLGCAPGEVLDRLVRGETAFQPARFASSPACPVFAPVVDFDAARYFPDNKTLRLMNRDAQMAVVAARLAMLDAAVVPDALYPAEDIALYGATGLLGMPPAEIASLLQNAAGEDGSLDLRRFGQVALRRIRPVLSFKILANMPICFVSIFENLRGPNAVYTPWEGSGAQAIAAGIRDVGNGEVPCAVVGGCDVKTHALSFLSLEQLGLLDSWRHNGSGSVPGEGAAFLVLERHERAVGRGARVYASIQGSSLRSITPQAALPDVLTEALRHLKVPSRALVVSASDGDPLYSEAERVAMEAAGLGHCRAIHPKSHLGNLFAAAAPVQLALAALLAARRQGVPVVANCFGHGTEQAAFVVEAA